MIHRGTHRVVAVPDADRVDHGARGPANQARPHREVETIQAGVKVRLYEQSHLIDKMRHDGQLTEPQFRAAELVACLHADAGLEPRQTPGYGPVGGGGGHTDEAPEMVSITRFRTLLNGERTAEVSAAGAWVLHGLCLGEHPGPLRIGTLRCALSALARRWGC